MKPCCPTMSWPRSQWACASWTSWRQSVPDSVIRGGLVVTPDGVRTEDIAIEGGQISAIGAELAGGTEEIDARGLHIFPGVIDAHLHFNEPGRAEWEGAATGSR